MQPTVISDSPDQPAPTEGAVPAPRRVQVRLLFAVAAALLGTAIVLATLLLLVNRDDWWRGFLAAAVASALAAGASVVPLLWCLGRGLTTVVGGYFAATGARLVISVGGCLLAVQSGGYPAVPTLLLMVPFYFAVLAAETAVVTRAIWNARA